MMRSAADLDTPNSGASWRKVGSNGAVQDGSDAVITPDTL